MPGYPKCPRERWVEFYDQSGRFQYTNGQTFHKSAVFLSFSFLVWLKLSVFRSSEFILYSYNFSNLPSQDSARNSPMSDQSSNFDSVLGTAINLGIHSVNDKGGLHYPKVSALAREAKEMTGVRAKKEEKQSEGRTFVI